MRKADLSALHNLDVAIAGKSALGANADSYPLLFGKQHDKVIITNVCPGLDRTVNKVLSNPPLL